MPQIPMPPWAQLGITRDDVLRETPARTKVALADGAARLIERRISAQASEAINDILETHEMIFGECPVNAKPPAQWSEDEQEWVNDLREELALTFGEWKTPIGDFAAALRVSEPWKLDDRLLRAQWIGRAIGQAARTEGDGRFLAAFGVVAEDYAEAANDAAPAPVAVAPPPLPPAAPAAPPAPPAPPVPAAAPSTRGGAPSLPGAKVPAASAEDIVRGFGLLNEAINPDTTKLAEALGISASGLRNYLHKGMAPRKFTAHQAGVILGEVDRRIDLLRRSAEIFSAVKD